jgi:3D (Asp-Asp-Asp) domain-containing protein
MTPSTVTPFQNQAWQHIEKQVDKNEMVFQTNELGLIKTDLEIQLEKDKIEFEKERLRKQKELEEQKRNEPEWREFELTFYSSLNCENGFGSITSTGSKLFDGVVASNYYKINTKIKLQGWGEVTVLDRGSNKYFNNDYRLDVYVPREQGESDNHYYSRVNKMGRIKVKGCIINE